MVLFVAMNLVAVAHMHKLCTRFSMEDSQAIWKKSDDEFTGGLYAPLIRHI